VPIGLEIIEHSVAISGVTMLDASVEEVRWLNEGVLGIIFPGDWGGRKQLASLDLELVGRLRSVLGVPGEG